METKKYKTVKKLVGLIIGAGLYTLLSFGLNKIHMEPDNRINEEPIPCPEEISNSDITEMPDIEIIDNIEIDYSGIELN